MEPAGVRGQPRAEHPPQPSRGIVSSCPCASPHSPASGNPFCCCAQSRRAPFSAAEKPRLRRRRLSEPLGASHFSPRLLGISIFCMILAFEMAILIAAQDSIERFCNQPVLYSWTLTLNAATDIVGARARTVCAVGLTWIIRPPKSQRAGAGLLTQGLGSPAALPQRAHRWTHGTSSLGCRPPSALHRELLPGPGGHPSCEPPKPAAWQRGGPLG